MRLLCSISYENLDVLRQVYNNAVYKVLDPVKLALSTSIITRPIDFVSLLFPPLLVSSGKADNFSIIFRTFVNTCKTAHS